MIHKKDVYVSDIQPFANYSAIKISFIRMMKEQKFKFHLIYYLRKGDKKGFEWNIKGTLYRENIKETKWLQVQNISSHVLPRRCFSDKSVWL